MIIPSLDDVNMYPSIKTATIRKSVILRKLTVETKNTINLCLELIRFGTISTLIFFDMEYCEYYGGKNKEQRLEKGGYELEFLANLVASYLFEKYNTLLNRTTYHVIYRDDGLVLFKVNNSAQ